MRFIATFLISIFLVGCGYKPVAKITKDIIGDDVYVHVIINKADPKSSVQIADSVKEGVVSRLNKRLSDDKNAKTKITVAIKSMRLQALLYDEYGYVSMYKILLNLEFDTKFENGSSDKTVTTGEYDFAISQKIKNVRYADSVISENERSNAIKEASKEAFDEYIASLAIKGYKNVDKN